MDNILKSLRSCEDPQVKKAVMAIENLIEVNEALNEKIDQVNRVSFRLKATLTDFLDFIDGGIDKNPKRFPLMRKEVSIFREILNEEDVKMLEAPLLLGIIDDDGILYTNDRMETILEEMGLKLVTIQ